MINYELVLVISAAGFMWSEVLTREDMFFGWIPGLISKVFGTDVVRKDKWSRPVYRREWLRPIEKPLYSCAVCVTGFWGLVAVLFLGVQSPLLYCILSMLLTKILLRYT